MARPKKAVQDLEKIEEKIKKEEGTSPAIEDMPLETFRDYRLYNEEARRLNKKYKVCRYPIKQCPEELHPKQRIIFTRTNGNTSPLSVYLSDWRIDFKKTLVPGQAYDLPECVIHHLEGLGEPIWARKENKDGSYESAKVGKNPRFAIRTVYQEQ